MDIQLDYFSRQHWDRVAQARGTGSSDIGSVLVDSLVATVRTAAPAAVLDVGSGNGTLACALTAGIPQAEVVGLDYSEAAVLIAREQLLPACTADVRERLSFLTGSADEMPFEDGRFDAITMLKTAWVLPDLPAALAECRRVLRPGGRIFIQTWDDSRRCVALRLGSAVLGETIGGFVLPPEAMAPFELTPARIAGEVGAAGFDVERQPLFSTEVVVDSAAQYWDRLRSIAGTAYWALAVQPREDRALLDDAWQRHSERYRDQDGPARLPLGWFVTVGTAR
jgi:SAM-dependent methyltransferase